MSGTAKRQQINVLTDDAFDQAVAGLQRLDQAGTKVPTKSEVIRKAVFETYERWRQKAERRKT